ncbi:MAG TPA: hypothetical protein VNJ01_09905 [Bacteriovoracaceae bacterium]|nr:hypothetical protein [Bacteriovoracaceae bacterium]
MPVIFLLLLISTAFALPCGPHEIYIREQKIEAYTKLDGTKVTAHPRDAHCREIERSNYFQDSTNQKFIKIRPRIKKWTASEKKIVQENLALLPPWLSKYHLQEVLRGDIGGHPDNPAASVVPTRTLLIFDQFFKEKDKRAIVIHEMAHIASRSIDPALVIEFSRASGWTVNDNFEPVPPQKLLIPDSQNSINEDLTNHIEVYYTDLPRLMTSNTLAFLTMKKIIESKEND